MHLLLFVHFHFHVEKACQKAEAVNTEQTAYSLSDSYKKSVFINPGQKKEFKRGIPGKM